MGERSLEEILMESCSPLQKLVVAAWPILGTSSEHVSSTFVPISLVLVTVMLKREFNWN